MPEISIITATYNRPNLLERAGKSLKLQTFQDFEWIVIDDGSYTDVDENSLPRQTQLLKISHCGQAKALKYASLKATGKYIGMLDDDDFLHPKCLEKALSYIQGKEVIFTNRFLVNESGELGIDRRSEKEPTFENLLTQMIAFHFRLIRRDTWEKVGGINIEYPVAYDYDLMLRLCEVTKLYYLPERLYYYQLHRNSISQSKYFEQLYWSIKASEEAVKRSGKPYLIHLDYKLQVLCPK